MGDPSSITLANWKRKRLGRHILIQARNHLLPSPLIPLKEGNCDMTGGRKNCCGSVGGGGEQGRDYLTPLSPQSVSQCQISFPSSAGVQPEDGRTNNQQKRLCKL